MLIIFDLQEQCNYEVRSMSCTITNKRYILAIRCPSLYYKQYEVQRTQGKLLDRQICTNKLGNLALVKSLQQRDADGKVRVGLAH